MATRRCREHRQVVDLGIPSRDSIVGPRRRIAPKGPIRRERGQVDHVMTRQSGGAVEAN